MAAPALKPCPVCAGTKLTGSSRVRCQDCGMWVDQSHEGLTAFVWNRLSDLAAARTNAAVREALSDIGGVGYAHPKDAKTLHDEAVDRARAALNPQQEPDHGAA